MSAPTVTAVDCLADDLLGLLDRIENRLPPGHDATTRARVDATQTVVNEVCAVIDFHLFKDVTP